MVALIGASKCGKTSLGNAILGSGYGVTDQNNLFKDSVGNEVTSKDGHLFG